MSDPKEIREAEANIGIIAHVDSDHAQTIRDAALAYADILDYWAEEEKAFDRLLKWLDEDDGEPNPRLKSLFENNPLLEDPIWWCFEHGRPIPTLPDGGPYFKTCVAEESRRIHNLPPTQCDIAKATRPRRIE